MSQTLILRYTPDQRDYAQVLRLFFLQRTGTQISLAFLVIAFGMILYAIVSKGTPPTVFELIWLVLPPLFVIFVFFVQPSRISRQTVGNDQLTSETTWEVGDTGVQISSRFGSTHLGWEALNKLVTTREYFLLLLKDNKNAFRFLPRRAFTSPQVQEQFMELMASHLPKR